MIRSITLENFFSFKEETIIDLTDINILLGINGSGKSTLLKAIRLLHEAVAGVGFENIFQKEWGGFNQVVNTNGGHAKFIKIKYKLDAEALNKTKPSRSSFKYPYNPTYQITIHPIGLVGYYLSEILFVEDKLLEEKTRYITDKPIGTEVAEFDRKGKLIEYKHIDDISFQESVLQQISDRSRYPYMYMLKEAIKQISVYDYFNTSSASPIRKPSDYSTETVLNRTGDNLAQVLSKLQINNSLAYDEIEKLLQRVNPNFKSIQFEQFPSQIYLSLKESNLNKTIGASHISDGTLRFLLYMTMLYNPNRGGLICIDEPENGLHPDMINTLAQAVKHASQTTQILIATHSPLLVNCFELEDILVFEKDAENKTVVTRKSEDEFEDWEGEFIPGQMWIRGQLGGKRW
ncbi:putative ATPase [Dysgonomonas alginatilytica]|uniref:Putative ATPase n=1 Tax=Dysgonomonas alginatilytica TaxID=1605892 RepID=A0A2V3PWP2_9BACT|nr:AAA family ATPase [Dysgonomonas alginatilytica]PXV69271.1 putative ATPase [Dysgonomonas alginatilytica]